MLELILDGLPGPNGIAISPDGRSLCVALTRPNQILRASLLPDGSVGRVQTFIQLSGGHGPDGIAFDQAGGLAVAHPGLGVVWLFNARGEPILRVDLCEGSFGTNIAYGGPDNNELYITESHTGKIHVVTMPAPGLPMYSHSDS
jgi:gluconolactonase